LIFRVFFCSRRVISEARLQAFDTWRSVGEKSFVQRFVSAAKYLTIWGRFTAVQTSFGAIGAASVYFPVIGFTLGLVLAFSNYALAPYLPTEILSITLIMVVIILTGGLHLEALYLTFAARDPKISPLDHRGNGAIGAIALGMVLLFKAAALDSIDQKVTLSLLLAPVLARWTLLVFIFGYQEQCEEMAKAIAQQMKLWHLLLATAGSDELLARPERSLDCAGTVSVVLVGKKSLLSTPRNDHFRTVRRDHRTRGNPCTDSTSIDLARGTAVGWNS
jgi:cobalamin synthase